MYLDAAREKLERLTEKGYDIFQCDACVFSADSFVPSAWAAQGQPPAIPHKWTSKKYVAVFAAISEKKNASYRCTSWARPSKPRTSTTSSSN